MAVTEGDRGAVIHTADWSVAVDGFAVEVVDTVGCGDAFMASLLAGLLSSRPCRPRPRRDGRGSAAAPAPPAR